MGSRLRGLPSPSGPPAIAAKRIHTPVALPLNIRGELRDHLGNIRSELRDRLGLRVVASCGLLLGQRLRMRRIVSRLSLIVVAFGRRRRVGRGEEEVHLAVFDLGVQGQLIEQLRSLGLDEHPRTPVVDEGITGYRLSDEHELEPLVAWRYA